MSTESEVTLTVEQFRTDFPEFTESLYADAVIQAAIDRSACFISRTNSGPLMDDCRILAIGYATAHLLTSACGTNATNGGGSQGGLVGASTVGSVSVTIIPPPSSTQFQYWMNQTCYGQAYLSLLASKAPAGIFTGGSFIRVLR